MPYKTNTPLLSILPEQGYQDNPLSAALTAPTDLKYAEVLALLESMSTKLTVDGCPEEMLDYLAYLVGMSGAYWDSTWSASVKRGFICNAAMLWRLKGTQRSIETALNIHGIVYKIWVGNRITLPSKLPTTFGKRTLRFFVRLPLTTGRTSYDYLEANRVLTNYKPVVTDGRVCYEQFKLGYSKMGEPVFK